MAIDIMALLRQTRTQRAGDIETLASKLVDGQQVPAEEVLRTMTALGISEKDLQTECDRIERVRQLRQRVASAGDITKRLSRLDIELGKLTAAHQKTSQALHEWHQRHDEQHMALRHQIEAAERARHELMVSRNLTGRDRDAIADAEHVLAEASAAAGDKQQHVADLRSQLRTSESLLAQQGAADRNMMDAETRRQVDHLTQTIDKAKQKLGEAEAELTPLRQQADAAESALHDVTEAIRRRVMAA